MTLLVAVLIALPLGVVLGHAHRGGFLAINVANFGRALPSMALLALAAAHRLCAPPWARASGRRFWRSVPLGIPPILTNSYVAVREVDRDIVESARGMGLREDQVLRDVELPIAAPLIIAGIRNAAVAIVATATLGALVAGGGLGRYIVDGIARQEYPRLFVGALLVALLAIAVEVGFGAVRARGRFQRRARCATTLLAWICRSSRADARRRDARGAGAACRPGSRHADAGVHEVQHALPGAEHGDAAAPPVARMLAAQRLPSFEAWRAAVLELWHAAAFREERYAALFIVGYRDYKAFRTLEALPLYQELIVSGAWWDLVDGLASHEVGDLLRSFLTRCGRSCSRGAAATTIGCVARRSSARSDRSAPPTSNCCSRVSSRASGSATSFCAKASVGRSANTRRSRLSESCEYIASASRRSSAG